MKDSWESFWKEEKYPPIVEFPPPELYGGTNTEPEASIGMSKFLDPNRNAFTEGFGIVDYGCGAGILANFISARLNDFYYLGLEPDTKHGRERIEIAKSYFNDPRTNFGIIKTGGLKSTSIRIDLIVVISVFTHLQFGDIRSILDELIIIFDYNPEAKIVFSCFTDHDVRVENPEPHIAPNFYGKSYIYKPSLEMYCSNKQVNLVKEQDFVAAGGHVHEIFSISKEYI